MNKNILARQQWAKFGACAGIPKGPEPNVTYQSFEVIHLGQSDRQTQTGSQRDRNRERGRETDTDTDTVEE